MQTLKNRPRNYNSEKKIEHFLNVILNIALVTDVS
jgi:hypothetical protein